MVAIDYCISQWYYEDLSDSDDLSVKSYILEYVESEFGTIDILQLISTLLEKNICCTRNIFYLSCT